MLLAATRDETIGVDVFVYQKPIFLIAKRNQSIIKYMQNPYIKYFEPAYVILAYAASQFGEIFWFFLFAQALIIAFVFLTIWHFRNLVPAYLSLACFLFVYYLHGYNITRQSIAMAIVLYAVVLADQNKYILMCLMELLAIGFHTSAIVGVGIIFLYFAGKGQFKKVYTAFIILGVLTISLFFRQIFIWIVNIVPFLPQRYIGKIYLYLEGGTDFTASRFFYVSSTIIILLCIAGSKLKEHVRNYDFLLYMMVLAFCGIVIGSQATFAYRVFIYPEMFSIFVIPQALLLVSTQKGNRLIGKIILYAVLVIFFIFSYMIKNYGAVYPYIFNRELL